MQIFDYRGYFVILEKNPNGSIRAVADNDLDRFGIVYYDYPMAEIKRRVKAQCNHRLENNIREGYSL